VRPHEPVADIDVVQVLFHDLVAADPDEGVPVTMLEFHIAHFGSRFRFGNRLALLKLSTGPPSQLAFIATISPAWVFS
jgi:hypothetical protein